jgi:hypothetical protein
MWVPPPHQSFTLPLTHSHLHPGPHPPAQPRPSPLCVPWCLCMACAALVVTPCLTVNPTAPCSSACWPLSWGTPNMQAGIQAAALHLLANSMFYNNTNRRRVVDMPKAVWKLLMLCRHESNECAKVSSAGARGDVAGPPLSFGAAPPTAIATYPHTYFPHIIGNPTAGLLRSLCSTRCAL